MRSHEEEICPRCGSLNIAWIIWGRPAYTEELRRDLEDGKVELGGCFIAPGAPQYHCNDCGAEFGEVNFPWPFEDKRLKSIVYGAAVGDALGVPFEGRARGTFECTHMVSGYRQGMPVGTFSDDTSLMLATCDSIKAYGGAIQLKDMAARFHDWLYEGAYTPDGMAFGIGRTCATAIEQGYGCDSEMSNGYGSLMRIAPLALTAADDSEITAVSAITHAHPVSTKSCVAFIGILRDVLQGTNLPTAIKRNAPHDERFAFLNNIEEKTRDEIRSSGYVLHTLEAALWCNLMTDNFAECVQLAVNLGGDTDTTASVAGALAGARYGFYSIPERWIESLRAKDVIDSCLFDIPTQNADAQWMRRQ